MIVCQYAQSFTIWAIYSRTLIKLGQFQEALRAAERAQALNPNFSEAWYRKAYALDGLKRHREAVAALDKTLQLDPANTYARYLKGRILYTLQEDKKALAEYNLVLQVEPDSTEFLTSKSVVLMSLKRFEEVVTLCEKLIKLNPSSVAAWRSKALALHLLPVAKNGEALQAVETALGIDSNDSQALTIKATIFDDMRMYPQARELLTRAIAIDPTNELAIMGLEEMSNSNYW